MCTRIPKRYAILVGIDLYLNDGSRSSSIYERLSLHNLRGCKNDVEAIENFLRDKYKFENISILTSSSPVSNNEEGVACPVEPPELLPTFANIKTEFDAVYEHAAAGDFFFFHYSGHGAPLELQDDSPKGNRTEEPSLITVDFCCGQPAVRGWQLNQWLERLNKKGIQVVVTLDSCHSGGSWRSAGDYKSFRTPNGWSSVTTLPIDYQPPIDGQPAADSYKTIERAQRRAKLKTSWPINPDSFTLIAACGIEEKAAEKVIDGKTYGAFTWELLDYLREVGDKIVTYRMISDQLNIRLQDQTPAVYGRDRYLFFGSYEPFTTPPLIVKVKDNMVIIPAGRAHGVNRGSQFKILSDLVNAAISVDRVEELQCSAMIDDELSLLLKHFHHAVILSRWNLGEEETLQVYVDLAFGLEFRNRLQKRLEEKVVNHIELLETAEDHMDVLKLDKRGDDDAQIRGPAWLTGSDDAVRPLNLKNSDLGELAAEAALAIAHLARFRQIRLLGSHVSERPFNVSIKPVKEQAAGSYSLNQKLRFTFENTSAEALHFTVMVLSPEFSIEQLYPVRDFPQTVREGQKKSFNFSMTLPSGPSWVLESLCCTFRRDIIRTLVTRHRPVSWKSIELPNIWDASQPSLLKKPSSTREGSAAYGHDVEWWSHDVQIVTGSSKRV